MAKEIEFNGEVYEFPDEATRGQVTVYLRKKAGLTPGGDNPANAPSAPSADFSERSLAGEAIAGMGRSAAAATSREERHTPESVARDAAAVNNAIGATTGVALDMVGADHPVERVGKAIDLFAAPGKTPIENAAGFAKKAWRAAGETLRETNPVALVAPGAPGGVQSTFLRKLLDKAETQPPVDPARESLVQQRNEQKTAAARAIAAKASGEKIDPADRLALAKLRSGDVPKPDIDPAAGELATALPERPGGLVESAARATAQFPAALLETYIDPSNAEIMAGQSAAARTIAALPLPPQAKAAAQLALASGMSGYFLHGMSGSAGEAIGRATGGGLDQRFVETEAPHQLANMAFIGHMAGASGKPLAEHIDASRMDKIRRDTIARVESSRESAIKKVQSNTAKGESPYAGLTPDELSAVAPAERALQRFVGADDLESIAKAAFSDRPDINVKIHEDVSTIPQASRPAVSDIAPTIEGAYESGTNTVHLVRPMLESAADALRVAMHEKTHSLEGIEPAKLAVTSERLFKQQLLGLAEEGVLPREQAESLVGLTGKDFASAVRALDTGERSPMRAAADETLAVMRQAGFKSGAGDRLVAEPEVGPVNRALGAVANAIPGVALTPADVTSVVASQARRSATAPAPNRPVESVGEAPYYQGRAYEEPLASPSMPEPPAPPPPISVGDRVSAVGPKGKPIEGVLEKVSKSGKTAMVKLDDGKSVRVDMEKVTRPEARPIEAAPVATEAPVAPEAQQPAIEATPIAELPGLDRRSHAEIQRQFEGRRWADLTDAERIARGYQNELSGLPGKRYWDDAIDTPEGRAQRPDAFFYDLDDFKLLNHRLSHEGVDKVALPFIGDAFKEVLSRPEFKDAVSVAHRSGDEFTGRSPSKEISDAFVNAMNERLRDATFVFVHDGKTYYHKGLGGSHGTGPDIVAAEAASKQNKAERRVSGERVGYRDSELGLPPAGSEAGGDQGGREGVPSGSGAEVAPSPQAGAPLPAAGETRLSRSRPNDKLIRPILGDLVELSAQMMADKRNGIGDADALFDQLTTSMGEGYAKSIKRAAPYLYEQAQKAAADRNEAVSVVSDALAQKLEPKKKLGTSRDETTATIQKAVDYAREQVGIPERKADAETLADGQKLFDNLGVKGIENLVIERSQKAGGTLTDAETVAAKIAMMNADANRLAFSDPRVYAKRAAFANAFRITRTETARALRQGRWDITAPIDERVKNVLYEVFMDPAEGKVRPNDLKGAESQLKKLKDFLKKELGVEDIESIPIEKLTDEAYMTDAVRKWSAENATLSQKTRTWYLNSLVSAFKTHAANLTGNMMNFAMEYAAHRRLEARLNQLFGIDGVMPSDLKGMGAQMLKVQKLAWEDAAQYLKTGKNRLEESVFGADWVEQLRKQKRSFGGKAGTIIEGPTRMLGTEDAYFVSLIGHMEAYSSARQIARSEMKLKPGTQEYNDAVDSMLRDYGGEAWKRGMDRAEYLTFKDETGKFVRSLLALRRQHPNLTYITPFLTTPVNLISRGAEFVPGVGLVGRGLFKDIAAARRGEVNPSEFSYKYSRLAAAQAIGLGATLTAAALGATAFKDDNDEPFITGSEPPASFGRAETEARRRSLQPYTIKLPFMNERISYRRLDPLSTAIGLNVDLINLVRDTYRKKDYSRMLDQGKNALLGQLVGKTFLKGPGDWISWIQNEPGAPFPATEVAIGMYPNFLRQFPQAFDPYVRENRNYGAKEGEGGQGSIGRFVQTKLSRATGFPIGTEPKVNRWGDEVRKTGSPLYRMLVPFDRSGEEGISREGRMSDLKFLRSSDTLPEDIGDLPVEMSPKMKLGDRTFQLFPKDYAEAEKIAGEDLKRAALEMGILDDPRKPMEPWMVEALRKAAESGRRHAVGVMAPKYMALPQK